MGKPFKIRKGSYIYVEPSELDCMNQILNVLLHEKSMSTQMIVERTGRERKSVVMNIWKLVAKRIVDVQQHGRSRIFSIKPGMKKKMLTGLS